MLQVWLRGQHSPLAVWQADLKLWQEVEGWQQLQEIFSGYKSSQQKTICLYFPSTHLLQVTTELSGNQLKQLGDSGRQYLFEESSIAPVEQLVVRQINFVTSHYLYALAQDDVEAWQQSAILAGFTIAALLPDFLLLPIPEEGAGQQVVIYQDQYTTLLRHSQPQGMAVSYLPLMFERLPHLSEVCLLSSLDESIKATAYGDGGTTHLSDDLLNLDTLNTDTSELSLGKRVQSNYAEQTASLLAEKQILLTPLLATPLPIEAPNRHALNFFAKVSDTKLSPYLRVAAMVAISALVLQMAADGLQVYRYNAASAATQSAVSAQYQSWFPEDRLNPVTKLETQMDSKLRNGGRAPASHIAVLSRISPLIKQSSLKAQALIMQPTALSFTLIAPNRNSLDEFTTTLVSQGLTATLDRVNGNEQGEFSGQITVNIPQNNADANNTSASNAIDNDINNS